MSNVIHDHHVTAPILMIVKIIHMWYITYYLRRIKVLKWRNFRSDVRIDNLNLNHEKSFHYRF